MFNGTVNVDPQFGIHRLVKLIQGRSLRLLSQEFPVLKRKLQIYGRIRIFVRPREERRSQ